MTTYRRGASAAPKNTGGNFSRAHFFSLKDGEKRIIRFLTDYEPEGDVGGLLLLKQHTNVPTLPAPEDYKGDKWPDYMGAVCRRDPNLADRFDECIICDKIVPSHPDMKKASERFWGLCCIREHVWEQNKLIGVKDVYRTVTRKDDRGEEVTSQEQAIELLNFSMSNFFGRCSGFFGLYGTLLDRDYQVERKGTGLKTEYEFAPLDPIILADGRKLDLREDDLMARYLPEATEVGYAQASDNNLAPFIERQYEDQYFGRFFDARLRSVVTTPDAQELVPATVVASSEETAIDDEKMKSLKTRLRPSGDVPAAPGGLQDLS